MAGGKGAKNGVMYLGLGMLLGLIADFVYQSSGMPGYSRKLGVCAALNEGDVYQIGGIAAINAAGAMANNFSLTAITSGMMLGNVAPKLLAVMGQPRYLIYTFDPATGTLKPSSAANVRNITGEKPK